MQIRRFFTYLGTSGAMRISLMLGIVGAFLVICGLLFLAAIAGSWLGHSVPLIGTAQEETQPDNATPRDTPFDESGRPKVPVFFMADTRPGADLAAVEEELRLASGAGVRQFILQVPMPWDDPGFNEEQIVQPVETALRTEPASLVYLQLSLDPPVSWLDTHPDAVSITPEGERYPSLSSSLWKEDVTRAIDRMTEIIRAHALPVHGYIPGGLKDGRWSLPAGHDSSSSNTQAFREWLSKRYETTERLREAWGGMDVTLETAAIPEHIEEEEPSQVFYSLPKEQHYIDYQDFSANQCADVLVWLVDLFRARIEANSQILLPYGELYEGLDNCQAHLMLSRILECPINGLITPVSYHDRGVGGVGGLMGPVHAALMRGKEWYLIDDTRTGVSRDKASGQLTHMAELKIGDIQNVQKRNFGTALVMGLGLCWSDPEGDGALLDPSFWKLFGRMREIMADPSSRSMATTSLEQHASLCAVVDGKSRLYQRCGALMNRHLLLETRNVAATTGVPVRYCLLDDVISGNAPKASAYLFMNAFQLNDERRNQLHARLAEQKALAIWLYAPGYFSDGNASPANISATTRFDVEAFDKPHRPGSRLTVQSAQTDEELPEQQKEPLWSPMFHIVSEKDEDAAPLARYTDGGQISIAMKFVEEGWATAYVADPELTVPILRQLLGIIEEPLPFTSADGRKPDVVAWGNNTVMIHACGASGVERTLELAGVFDIHDLLDERVGWPRKQELGFSMRLGETYVLSLTPIHDVDAAQADDQLLDTELDQDDASSANGEPAETAAPASSQ